MYSNQTNYQGNATDALKDYIEKHRKTRYKRGSSRLKVSSGRDFNHKSISPISSKYLLGSAVRSPERVISKRSIKHSIGLSSQPPKFEHTVDPTWDLDSFASATAVDKRLVRRLYRNNWSSAAPLDKFSVLETKTTENIPVRDPSDSFRRAQARVELNQSLENLKKSVLQKQNTLTESTLKYKAKEEANMSRRFDRSLLWSALEAEIQSGLRCVNAQSHSDSVKKGTSGRSDPFYHVKTRNLARSIEDLLGSVVTDNTSSDIYSSSDRHIISDEPVTKVDFGSQFSPEKVEPSPVVAVPLGALPLGVSVTLSNTKEEARPHMDSLLSRIDALTSASNTSPRFVVPTQSLRAESVTEGNTRVNIDNAVKSDSHNNIMEDKEAKLVDQETETTTTVPEKSMTATDLLNPIENSTMKENYQKTPIILAIPSSIKKDEVRWISQAKKAVSRFSSDDALLVNVLHLYDDNEEKEKKVVEGEKQGEMTAHSHTEVEDSGDVKVDPVEAKSEEEPKSQPKSLHNDETSWQADDNSRSRHMIFDREPMSSSASLNSGYGGVSRGRNVPHSYPELANHNLPANRMFESKTEHPLGFPQKPTYWNTQSQFNSEFQSIPSHPHDGPRLWRDSHASFNASSGIDYRRSIPNTQFTWEKPTESFHGSKITIPLEGGPLSIGRQECKNEPTKHKHGKKSSSRRSKSPFWTSLPNRSPDVITARSKHSRTAESSKGDADCSWVSVGPL